jgi:hypothetical protein
MSIWFWLGVILFVIIGITVTLTVLADRSARRRLKTAKKVYAEYMDRTLPCPTCYGRGRICKPGAFADQTPKKKYEKEMSENDIPYAIREAMDDDKN